MSRMKILYIFPHPDDESFGPAAAMSKQRRQGHEVHLLTLTKGGATKQRHKYGYSVEEMGEVRYREMLNVAKALDLNEMTVLDLPDSGLKETDPREIEKVVIDEIERIQPHVIVFETLFGGPAFGEGQQVNLVSLSPLFGHYMRRAERFIIGMGKYIKYLHSSPVK